MEHTLLVASAIVQVGLGTYILFQDARSRAHRLFAVFMLVSALSTLVGLLRLVVTRESIAVNLMVSSTIVIFIWNATAIVASVIAIFYSTWADRETFWALHFPVGAALLGTVSILGIYVAMPDKTAIVTLVPGTYIYALSYQFRRWALVYQVVCIVISLALLGNVVVRRPGIEQRSAIIIGTAINRIVAVIVDPPLP